MTANEPISVLPGPCPSSPRSRGGPCVATRDGHACAHRAPVLRRLCVCCMRRLPRELLDELDRSFYRRPFAAYVVVESRALEVLGGAP